MPPDNRPDRPVPLSRAVRFAVSELAHGAMLKLARPLDSHTLGNTLGPTAPCIGFHVWHSARWADLTAAELVRMAPALSERLSGRELWTDQGWAERFGCGTGPGFQGTGMKAEADDIAGLPLGDPALVIGYAEAAFEAADAAFGCLDEETLTQRCTDQYGRHSSIGVVLTAHAGHVSRHLGMIEALIGLAGQPGTATW